MPTVIAVRAPPVVVSQLVHGQPFTVTGSGFGTKSMQLAPVVRDIGAAAVNTLDSQWSGGHPRSGTAAYQIQNQNVGFAPSGANIGAPHPYVSKILAGAHGDFANSDDGWNVGPFYFWSSTPTAPYSLYMKWWQRCDPNWVFVTQSQTNDHNFKTVDFDNGFGVGDLQSWDIVFDVPGPANNTVVDWQVGMGDDSGITVENPDGNGHGQFWGHALSPFRAANGWIANELEVRVSTATGLAGGGAMRFYDNCIKIVNYAGRTDNFTTNPNPARRSISPAWFARDSGNPNNYRYFADLIIDISASNTLNVARAMVGNNPVYANCTVREYSTLTALSDASATATFWKGALQGGTTGYIFIVTEANTVVSAGSATIASSP